MTPLRHWPAIDAPMIEWLHPVSALLDVPAMATEKAAQTGTGRHSAMLQRVNKKRRKQAITQRPRNG